MDFAVSDIWMYNGNCVFACSTFQQRYEWLQKLLSTFTSCVAGVTIDLIHKSDLDMSEVRLRGHETYLDEIGKSGFFEEDDGTHVIKVKRLAIPDCYEVSKGGYLKVPDLKTSLHLRSLGQEFEIRCKKNEDGSWTII